MERLMKMNCMFGHEERPGKGKGTKTNWLMYEYIVTQNCASDTPQVKPRKIDEWVLCKVYVNRRNYKNLQTTSAKPEETNHQNLENLQGEPSTILKNVNGPHENQFEAQDHVPYQISSNPNHMDSTQVSDQILEETVHQNLWVTHQTPIIYLQNQIPITVDDYAYQCPNSVEYTNSFADDHAFDQNMDQYLQAGSSTNILNSSAPFNTYYDYHHLPDHPSYLKYTQLSYQNSEETSHQNLGDLDHVPNQIPLNTDHDGHVQHHLSYGNYEDLKGCDQLMSAEDKLSLIDSLK
ncbi:NAC domain containing protein [Trema orientale]|uniref:NAC domain containing protein n=1 Tax=Trema orientale TaxID=63057 RepID=A0A2P5E670_TREOI|nr:NAC domain containing protein [Trema orientale]